MTKRYCSLQDGSSKLGVLFGVSVFLLVGSLAFGVWSFVNYLDQKQDVDIKISKAVDAAKKEQADADEIKRQESLKVPNLVFYGPSDYGRVTFNYPKTWSTYVSKDGSSGGSFEAYLNPVAVPPITSGQLFALRVVIKTEDYDKALTSYSSLVKSGKLESSAVSADGSNGTRFDGNFSDNLRGSLVIFKIRDKTLTIRTDANTFTEDFNAIVSSIEFNE